MNKNNIKVNRKILVSIICTIITAILLAIPKNKEVFKENETEALNRRTLAIYINEGDGNYTISNNREFPKEGYILNTEKTTCKNGTTFTQDTTTRSIKGTFKTTDSCNLYFDKEEKRGLIPQMVQAIVNNNTMPKNSVKEGSPTFANPAITNETEDGLYVMEDDYGTSYYFRGTVENNYVKFGDFFWRIIRINGDGSLRMIYDGTSTHPNGENNIDRLALISVAWDTTNHYDAKYVGYMYSPSSTTASTSKVQAQTNEVNSNVKKELENWYKTNIRDKDLDGYVADSVYCNDRSTPGKSETGWNDDTGLGYGRNKTGYGATIRSNIWNTDINKVQPKFICSNKNDTFTKENIEKGNSKLEEKVGLITADEIIAAGSGKYNTANKNNYLYKGNKYWSLSPCYYNVYASMFVVGNDGQLYDMNVSSTEGGIAPVISLTPEYVSQMIGDGTIGNEYRVV